MTPQYYFMAGEYPQRIPEPPQAEVKLIAPVAKWKFLLVRPNGEDSLPYVTENPEASLYRLCRHHAHLYRLDGGKAILVRKGDDEDGVLAPDEYPLSEKQLTELQQVIRTGGLLT